MGGLLPGNLVSRTIKIEGLMDNPVSAVIFLRLAKGLRGKDLKDKMEELFH
ncbi:MAG: hypothetical protein LIO79_02180 [Rikenellaceae bacterium]|nr:hypothetical protein [Rikenellaceae bacterium]